MDGFVHVVERLAPGGIETLVADLISARPGDQVISLNGTTDELIAAWPRLEAVASRTSAFNKAAANRFRLIWNLRQRLSSLRPKAVFVHHIGPLLYGGLAARMAGVSKLVYVEHDAWHYQVERLDVGIFRACNTLLRPALAAVSRPVADVMRPMAGQRDIAVVPPGIPTSHFVPAPSSVARSWLGLPPDRPVIGTVGRLTPVKGLDVLLRAASQIRADAMFVIVGDGPARASLEELARSLGLAERVRFLGHRDDREKIFPAFDVLCLPSRAEGLPRVILEAQSCGVPVVASDVGAVASALGPGSLAIEPGDATLLAQTLTRQIDEPRDGAKLRSFVERNFSLDATLTAYAKLAAD